MDRPAGQDRTHRPRSRALGRDGCVRVRVSSPVLWLAARLGILLLLLLTTSPLAQARSVDVRPMDARVFTVDPREVVTQVFEVVNRTGATADLEGRLILPAGWRAITPEFPFSLPAGGRAMRLVSFLVPEGTAAGEYRVSYQVGIRGRPGALGGVTLAVRVRPVYKLQVDLLELPSVVISNEPYQASFQIINSSNTALAVGFGATSSRESKVTPTAGSLTLEPGETQIIRLDIRPPKVEQPTRDEISLSVSAPEFDLADTAKRSVEILPRVTGRERPYHEIKTYFTQRLGASWSGRDDGRDGAGAQLEWSGSGAIDGTRERMLSFFLRGPSLNENSIFGQEDWLYVDYRGRQFDLGLGDLGYGLSPLTELGTSGRGARLGWRGERWSAQGYHMDVRDSSDGEHQSGLGVDYKLNPNWSMSLNLLDKQDSVDGRNQIIGLRQRIAPREDLTLDLELAESVGDTDGGTAVWAELVKLSAPWRYRVTLLQADPGFAGYYQDQERAYLDLDYAPDNQPWSIRAYYHWDRDNLDDPPDLDDDTDDLFRLWRPEDSPWYGSASEEQEAGVGLSWRTETGSRYSAELRHRERRDLHTPSRFEETERTVRLGYGKSLQELNLSLNTSAELGWEHDRLTGRTAPSESFRGSLYWRPTKKLGLGGYLQWENETAADFDSAPQITAGASLSYAIDARSNLNLDLQGQDYDGRNSVILNARYNYKRDNGHVISVQARHGSRFAETYEDGWQMDNDIMLSYMMPIDMPVSRRKDVATVRGQAFDQETGKGIPNVILEMDRRVAITDERGYFHFPSVEVGVRQIKLAGGQLPVGMIPLIELPVEVNLHFDAGVPVKLPFIRGATILGKVQLYEPDPKLLPSQTFIQIGQGSQPPPIRSEDLVPTRGLGGILIEVRNGEQVYRRLTNGNGEFRFAGLQPGTWSVTLDTSKLPENASIEETSYTLEVEPSADASLEFRVEQKIRTMRMLAPLKVKG